VRVLLGRSGPVVGAGGTPEETTMLDGALQAGGRFSHSLADGHQAWIYTISGRQTARCQGEARLLEAGSATTVAAGHATDIVLEADEPAHFVLIAAKPIREPFVKHGPLVMSTAAEVRQTLARYAGGGFGRIPA
jgi:redox-sensitive bicupin YhaK (pirin superfamily)